ncbi:MAG: CocE/NonD family hydrolase [Gammaproteobacteria bacterium]|nr:CocE/NonD family hydrolase [Gammaproteobacteria bacterium]
MKRLITLILFSVVANLSVAADYPRNQSLYVEMRDGVKIAIDVWLPGNLEAGEEIPTLMQATRYWRAMEHTSGRIEDDNRFELANRVNDAGYAFVFVDARGSGASFGWRAYERSVEEATDYGEIADWIVRQPWSNQRIGTFGVSYAGNTAELTAINRHPAVKAVAPLFNDFDNFAHLAFPGGAFTSGTLDRWGNMIDMMDRNALCDMRRVSGDECDELRRTWLGVKRVDEDTDGKLLKQAIEEHAKNVHAYIAARNYQFRDDPWGEGGVVNAGYLGSPAGHLPAIEASGVAMFIRSGWQDAATVNGTLGRYMTISNPQQVSIGPWDHGAVRDADPFHEDDTPVSPTRDQQYAQMFAFFDRYLKDNGEPIESSITYYTLGADRWTMTTTWPPFGFTDEAWYFAEDGSLSTREPAERGGADKYRVDFNVTTGRHNRWFTNNGGGGDVVYGDRREMDKRLLTYTSAPFDSDRVFTGHPTITLFVRSTHEDGLFIAYLEDVAPDGRVTYITEGQLRAVMRKPADEPPLYKKMGPHHSQLRADAMPLVPGEVAELKFELWATSVLIKKGHRLRIAIAGADKDTFARYPLDGGEPVITIERNADFPSHVLLPARKNPTVFH